MENRKIFNYKDCFRVDGDSFAIAETQTPYVLCASVSCPNADAGKKAWEDAAGEIPEGWAAVTPEIPAGTPHNVYENVRKTYYHLKGCTDDKIIIIR